jgi:hypothetical protein
MGYDVNENERDTGGRGEPEARQMAYVRARAVSLEGVRAEGSSYEGYQAPALTMG